MTQTAEIKDQLQRTVKDSFIYMPARIIPAIIGILLIRVLTTLLSKEAYGYYQTTLTTFGLIRVFSMIWLSTSVTRFFQSFKKEGNSHTFYATLFFGALLASIAMGALAFSLNFFYFKTKLTLELYNLINLAIAASLINTFFESFVVIFRAGLEPKKYSIYWILFSVGKPLVGIILIYFFNFSANGIFWGFLVVPLILELIIFYQLDKFSFIKTSLFSRKLFKEFIRYGIPISMSFLSFWILSQSDRYFILHFCNAEEVGLYSVPYMISEKTLNFIYMIIMLAAFPIIIENFEKHGNAHTQQLITEITRYFLIVCTPILVVLVILPENVLLFFSDSKFLPGAQVLPFIAFAVYLNGLNQYVIKGFELHKKSLYIALLAIIAGSINVISNLFLIPRIGYIGAAYSAVIAYLIYFILSIIIVNKHLAWKPPFKSLLKIIIASLALAVFYKLLLVHIQNTWIITSLIIPMGLIIYIFLLLLIKELGWDEVNAGKTYILNKVSKR